MAPVEIESLHEPLPEKYVYLLNENSVPLYVGRTDHYPTADATAFERRGPTQSSHVRV